MLVYEVTYFQLIGNAVGLVPVAQRSSVLESMVPGMGRAVQSPQEAETGGNPPRLSFFQSSRNKLRIDSPPKDSPGADMAGTNLSPPSPSVVLSPSLCFLTAL
ncbi:Vezatin [Manis pentadactyla]|nr:Vezatin [Manis pentadactyla]